MFSLCSLCYIICVHSSAVDFIHEALRLLDEEPETPENADKLKDDKAHALLWLYICTLEKNLQEVSAVSSIICLFLWTAVVCLHKGVRRSKTESVKSSFHSVSPIQMNGKRVIYFNFKGTVWNQQLSPVKTRHQSLMTFCQNTF